MPSTQEQSPNQAHPLLMGITQDERVRSLLLSWHVFDKPRRDELVVVLYDKIRNLEPAHKYALYCDSLDYLANEDCYGGQDGRDALAIVFPQVATETSALEYNNQDRAANRLTRPFIKALDQISPTKSDTYGSFDAIMRAGLAVAAEARVVQNTAQRNEFVATVKEKAGAFLQTINDEPAVEYGSRLFETFKSTVIFGGNQAEFQGQNKQEKTRAKPNMGVTETLLHDRYLETVRQHGIMKHILWEAIPLFRTTCAENGIDLARFWNRQNPDDIASAINKLQTSSPQAYELLRNEAAGSGISVVLESQEAVRVHADELYRTAQIAHEDLARQVADIGKDIERIATVMSRDSWQNTRAKANFYNQMAKLAKTYGVLEENESSEINILHIHGALETKAQILVQSQKALEAAFDNFSNTNSRFSISSRTKADMFFSDETGDCTAYHLDCGMNGQTVPIWLSMPNFVFGLIHDDEGSMLAKMGLLLGWRDNQPCLVIDSIESSRLITPSKELEASVYIDEGLSSMIEWGRSIGLSVTYGYSFNNSSDLIKQIEDRSVAAVAEDFELFGGLDGLHEYMESFGCGSRDYNLHLQTYYRENIGDNNEAEATAAELLAFETAIKSVTNGASKENRAKLLVTLGTGDYQQFANIYLRLYCNDILSFLDMTPEELYRQAQSKELLALRGDARVGRVIDDELIAAFGVNEHKLEYAAKLEGEFEKKLGITSTKDIDVYNAGKAEDGAYQLNIYDGVVDSTYKVMDILDIEGLLSTLSPTEAFQRIYGAITPVAHLDKEQTNATPARLILNPKLPRIVKKT